MKRRDLLLLGFIIVIIVGVALGYSLYNGSNTTITDLRRNTIMEQNSELNPTRTWCFGRFIINTPATARIYWKHQDKKSEEFTFEKEMVSGEYGGVWKFRLAEIEIPPETMTHKEFVKKMDSYLNELRSAKHKSGKGLLVQLEQPDPNTYVIARWHNEFSEGVLATEGYKWSNGLMFVLKADAGIAKQERAVTRMLSRLEGLRQRNSDEVPEDAGFCFPGGIFAEEYGGAEYVFFTFVFPDTPDLILEIHTFTTRVVDPPLLSRQGGIMNGLGNMMSQIKTLRADNRKLDRFAGQELLLAFPGKNGGRAHMFKWEVSSGETVETPFIAISMQTGRMENPSSFTDEKAIALWDTILESFKLRPVKGTDKKAEAFPTQVASGDKCPKTGDWRCVEDGGVIKFYEGQIMPPAVYYKPATGLMNKLKGIKQVPSHQGPGNWVWVEPKLPEAEPQQAKSTDTAAAPEPAKEIKDDTNDLT